MVILLQNDQYNTLLFSNNIFSMQTSERSASVFEEIFKCLLDLKPKLTAGSNLWSIKHGLWKIFSNKNIHCSRIFLNLNVFLIFLIFPHNNFNYQYTSTLSKLQLCDSRRKLVKTVNFPICKSLLALPQDSFGKVPGTASCQKSLSCLLLTEAKLS